MGRTQAREVTLGSPGVGGAGIKLKTQEARGDPGGVGVQTCDHSRLAFGPKWAGKMLVTFS